MVTKMFHNLLVPDGADVEVKKLSPGKLQGDPRFLGKGPKRTQKPGQVTPVAQA